MNKRLVAGIVAVAAVAALGAGYAINQAGSKLTVATASVTKGTLTVTASAPGTVDAHRVAVYATTGGTLKSVSVTDGQQVKAGDVLATLDDAALKVAVAQAEAQRAAARVMPRDTDNQINARNAAIAAADAALALTQVTAAKASITAPVAGTVTLNVLAITSLDGTGPKAAPGASVSAATPLFTIVDLAKPTFAAQVDEADIAGVTVGQAATVTLDAYPGRTFDGKVAEIASDAIATKTGGVAYVVRVPLTPGDAALRVGMSGDVALVTASVQDALVVPSAAVLAEASQRFVFKVVDGRAVKTPVTVGSANDTAVAITAGLAAGDVVATTQLPALKDGMAVNVGP